MWSHEMQTASAAEEKNVIPARSTAAMAGINRVIVSSVA